MPCLKHVKIGAGFELRPFVASEPVVFPFDFVASLFRTVGFK